jgi:hypothetical protein
VPIPLAPVTFFVSIGLLFLARQEYVKASLEGYPEGLRVKLGFAMAACLGNVFATIAEFALLAVAFYITLTSPMLDEAAKQSFTEVSPGITNTEINIETFNQNITNNIEHQKEFEKETTVSDNSLLELATKILDRQSPNSAKK